MSRTHHHATRRLPFGASNFLAVFEGIEGGFAIAAGLLAGLAFAGLDRSVLVTVVIISVVVHGFNAACVKYSTEHYLDELDGREKVNKLKYYFTPAFIQFLIYCAIGAVTFIPLFFIPYDDIAVLYCCITTVIILLLAGYLRASLMHMPRWRDGFEFAIIGTCIIGVGYISGWIIHIFVGA